MGFARNEHMNQAGPGSEARGEATEVHVNTGAMGWGGKAEDGNSHGSLPS